MINTFGRLFLFLILSYGLVEAHTAEAANLTTAVSAPEIDMGCNLAFRGEIKPGDGNAFINDLEAYMRSPERERDAASNLPTGRICLESIGGSLVDALEIVNFLLGQTSENLEFPNTRFHFKTAVAKDKKCLSACALIFLAGNESSFEDVIYMHFSETGRWIHPRAVIGFHSPSLPNIPKSLTAEQMQDLFKLGARAISEITSLRDEYPGYMSAALFQIFVETPFDEMAQLKKVEEAALWNIGLHMVMPPNSARFSGEPSAVSANLCANMFRWHADLWIANPTPPPHAFDNFFYLDEEWGRPRYAISGIDEPTDQSLGTQIGCTIVLFDEWDGEGPVPAGSLEFALFDFTGKFTNIYGSRSLGAGIAFAYSPYVRITGLPFFSSKTDMTTTISNGYLWRGLKKQSQTQSNTKKTCYSENKMLSVINVQQYTNLRAKAGIDNKIISRVPLNRKVTQLNPGGYLATQRCLRACDSNNKNAIQQCIENNEVWMEVEYNGRRGFLSRKFLTP